MVYVTCAFSAISSLSVRPQSYTLCGSASVVFGRQLACGSIKPAVIVKTCSSQDLLLLAEGTVSENQKISFVRLLMYGNQECALRVVRTVWRFVDSKKKKKRDQQF